MENIVKIEAAALTSYEERKIENNALINSLKKVKSELVCATTALKDKDKENYQVEQKNVNLSEKQ